MVAVELTKPKPLKSPDGRPAAYFRAEVVVN
jgi:hypothetical protein